MELLAYQLPAFKTIAWVSNEARDTWEPRIERVNQAIIASSVAAVLAGELQSCSLIVSGHYYFKLLEEVRSAGLKLAASSIGARGTAVYKVKLSSALFSGKVSSTCCSVCAEYRQKERKKEWIWEAARQAPAAQLEEDLIRLPATVNTAVFWSKLLLRFGEEYPCNLQCEHYHKQFEQYQNQMKQQGFATESEYLSTILSWPVEWSANHGICELRTPVVKFAYDTDASVRKYLVQVEGSEYPEEGAPGKQFPYKQRNFLRVTDSKSFKKGLEHGC